MNNSDNNEHISAVPTNIITGFLGAGKTSAIQSLLTSKPADERWAILVNEFGEIGVDGSLFAGLSGKEQSGEKQSVFIREVPGGCMCCAAGLPMQIALNQLLTRSKPDRLLIEPTGLGHPKEVLQVLTSHYYQEIISLQQVVTLVDARKLSDERYTNHDTFNQQIAIADLVVGNKIDLYTPEDREKLVLYLANQPMEHIRLIFAQNGRIDAKLLADESRSSGLIQKHSHDHHNHSTTEPTLAHADAPIPECGFIKAHNHGEGYNSVGWRFAPDHVFDREKLFSFLSGIQAERMKAVFVTQSGVFGYNLTTDALTEIELDDCLESRIEIISNSASEDWEARLMACRAYQPA